jgi:hypothetical protein
MTRENEKYRKARSSYGDSLNPGRGLWSGRVVPKMCAQEQRLSLRHTPVDSVTSVDDWKYIDCPG